jgi:hypothetical protein
MHGATCLYCPRAGPRASRGQTPRGACPRGLGDDVSSPGWNRAPLVTRLVCRCRSRSWPRLQTRRRVKFRARPAWGAAQSAGAAAAARRGRGSCNGLRTVLAGRAQIGSGTTLSSPPMRVSQAQPRSSQRTSRRARVNRPAVNSRYTILGPRVSGPTSTSEPRSATLWISRPNQDAAMADRTIRLGTVGKVISHCNLPNLRRVQPGPGG